MSWHRFFATILILSGLLFLWGSVVYLRSDKDLDNVRMNLIAVVFSIFIVATGVGLL